MASREAQEDFTGPMHEWKTAEGVATEVAYRDTQDAIIADITGGLRSGLTFMRVLTASANCSAS